MLKATIAITTVANNFRKKPRMLQFLELGKLYELALLEKNAAPFSCTHLGKIALEPVFTLQFENT